MGSSISAIIIAKNEEDRIGACIESLSSLDEVIVVDSGSTDDTVKIAQSKGAKVISSDWLGYGATKNFAHSHARNDWILSIDSDEYLSTELIQEISLLQVQNRTVYVMNRQNVYLGKKVNFSGWSPDWVYRFFHREDVKWNDNLVHEKLIIPADHKIVKLKGRLVHNSYRSVNDHLEKIDKYAKLKAESWLAQGRELSFLKRFAGAAFKAFHSYIIKLGLLDGSAGMAIARANYHLVKRQIYHYDKLKESIK